MLTKELLDFIRDENTRLSKRNNAIVNKKNLLLSILAKLMEETGELAKILHKHCVLTGELTQEQLQEAGFEIADIMIVALLLAQNLGINMDEHLQQKIEIIKNRNY